MRVLLLSFLAPTVVLGFIPLLVATTSSSRSGTCADTATRATATDLKYGGIAHAGILVSDTQKSLDFYLNTLGFEDDTHLRPNLPFPGAFVRGGVQQIHLMELPNPDPTTGRPQHGGRDRHVAFTIANIDPLIAKLNDKGWEFTMSKSGRRAVFCRDPDGNALEFMEDTTVA